MCMHLNDLHAYQLHVLRKPSKILQIYQILIKFWDYDIDSNIVHPIMEIIKIAFICTTAQICVAVVLVAQLCPTMKHYEL